MRPEIHNLAALVKRVETLERDLRAAKRRNRWLLTATASALVGFTLPWVLAHTTATAQVQGAKVIRASQFILEDENGKSRATLSASRGSPRVALFDENGKPIWTQPKRRWL